LAQAPPVPPKISDVELLSIISELGRAATDASIRHSINERLGGEVSVQLVRDRIAEVEAAGLALFSIHGPPFIRLTARGIKRLRGVDNLSRTN
jgi:hypothetical protein